MAMTSGKLKIARGFSFPAAAFASCQSTLASCIDGNACMAIEMPSQIKKYEAGSDNPSS